MCDINDIVQMKMMASVLGWDCGENKTCVDKFKLAWRTAGLPDNGVGITQAQVKKFKQCCGG